MATTYYDSSYTGAQIDAAVGKVTSLQVAANNGKVIVVDNGVLAAKSIDDIITDGNEVSY